MIRLVLKKEFLSALRDARLQLAGGLLLLLMLTAVLVGKQGQRMLQEERQQTQAAMYNQWLNQGNKHPHSAAHYGQFAFKPKPVLSFLDVGLDNYTGVSVFLEAHKQNEVLYSAAQDSNSMSRFGEMTAAMILQLLFPLLIIFLAYNSFSKEREEGTLKLLYAQGVSMRQVLAGKVGGIYSMVLLLFLPVTLLAYLLLDQQSASLDAGVTSKFLLLMLTYAAYFFLIVLLSVLCSGFVRQSGVALISLLGLWVLAGIILPKASANFADKLHPTPSQLEFRQTIKEAVKKGIDGHNPRDVRLASLKQEVLREYGVETIEELPVNWSGIAMQAGEEYSDLVYDREFSKIESIYRRQNRFSEWLGFLNPYLAVKHLSMALSGTDYHHHATFARAAEDYRRRFVKVMNKDMELNHKPGVAFSDYKVGEDFWRQIDPFTYQLPATGTVLGQQWRSLAALGAWLLVLALLSYSYAPNIPRL